MDAFRVVPHLRYSLLRGETQGSILSYMLEHTSRKRFLRYPQAEERRESASLTLWEQARRIYRSMKTESGAVSVKDMLLADISGLTKITIHVFQVILVSSPVALRSDGGDVVTVSLY